jgi:hypothetical protein
VCKPGRDNAANEGIHYVVFIHRESAFSPHGAPTRSSES